MKKSLLLFALIAICCFSMLHAQSPDSSKALSFDAAAATQKYLDILTPAQKAKSDAYFEGGYWLLLWNLLYSFVLGFIFLRFGLSKWIKSIATKIRFVNAQVFIYGAFYIVLSWILSFPMTVYQDFYREHQYDLSNLTFTAWLIENLKSLGLAAVFGSLILMALYAAIRRTGNRWWIWGSALMIGFTMFGAFIAPVFLMPIFNEYKPMNEGPLKNEILSMARANNIPADNVYQFDASKQSNKISANVSGFASTTRISLNDNLLKRCSPAEIKSVMGHEMGHYVMNHVYKGIMEMGILLLLTFAIANWAFNFIVSRWGAQFSITDIKDVAGLPLLALIFAVISFISTPVSNSTTRTQEIEADMFGLNVAREPDGFAAVSMKLSEYRKINPGHWEEIFFYDHPSGRVRVSTAMKWKAENLNNK